MHMAKYGSRDLDEDQVSALIYDDLFHIGKKVHATYECMKKKNSSLRKNFSPLIRKAHSSALIKIEGLEKKPLMNWRVIRLRLKLIF